MADTSSWSHSAAPLGGHYGSSAPQHSTSGYYQPPIFSSNMPSYTLTHTFTFPSYLSPAPSTTLTGHGQGHSQSQSQSQSQGQQTLQRLQPSSPSLSFPAYDISINATSTSAPSSAASIFHSPLLTSPGAAALPSLLSTSSSSPLSSSLSSSYPPSSSDSSSASQPASSRSRLSASERKARRAAKHRAIDLSRRTREAAALAHLKQLLSPSSANGTSSGGSAPSGSSASDGPTPTATAGSSTAASASANNASGDSKAAVLEQTVAEVMRLRAVIAAQQTMLSGQTAPLHRSVHPPLPHALSPEWPALYNHHIAQYSPAPHHPAASAPSTANGPPSAPSSAASSTLTSLSSDLHTLYSSFFLHSPYHLTLIQPGTAACIDTNGAFLAHARLPRSHVVGKRITLCPAVRLLLDRGDHIGADEFMGGRGVDCGRDRQASNGLNLVRLYSGASDTVLCVFRYVLSDGRVMDVRGRCWLTKGRFSGVVGEAPLMIIQSSEEDYVTVTG